VLAPHSWLNHYQIVRQIGAGGMGEVYEAEDTRLKRRVALKLLPPDFAGDPAVRARFEREAQAVAALNHPNIVTIYSIEESADTRFLTMEIIEGRTIDRLIPASGLAIADLVRYAIPVIDAVAAAHEHGVVHRDLKPANVMVTSDGRVKVLDFGIAKRIVPPMDRQMITTALTATVVGQIVGTAAYMSPEQAEGRAIDQRSDIFSIGVLLYEMATGTRPFRGDTTMALLSSILRDQPAPITTVRPDQPRELERLIDECLAKDPQNRPQSAKEVRDRLAALRIGEARAPRRRRAALAAAGAVMIVALGLLTLRWRQSVTPPAAVGTPTFARMTYDGGIKVSPSLSPDGRSIVYAASAEPWHPHIYLHHLDGSGATIDLSGNATWSDSTPAFSPDGRSIAFASSREGSNGLFVMSANGEGARRLVNGGIDPSWTPDGREIVYSTETGRDPDGREAPSELWAVEIATGNRRRVAATDAVDPHVSPDGRYVAFWALPVNASGTLFAGADRDVWVQPLASGQRVRITASESSDWNPAWSPDGRFLYFSSDRGGAMNIWRVAIDRTTGGPSGDPVPITAPAPFVGDMSFGADGTLVFTAYDYDTAVRAIAFDAASGVVVGAARDVLRSHRSWLQPDVSPDGRLITLRSFRGQEDIWVVGVDGAGLRQVTNDPARDRGSRFAPDGTLYFYSARSGTYEFWNIRVDGSGARQLTHDKQSLNYPLPSPDGRWVAGTSPNTNEQFIFDAHDWSKPPERLPQPTVKGQMYLRDWSPDGTRFAAADTSNGLWVFDRATRTWQRVGSGTYPRWLADGRRMLAVTSGGITLVDTANGSAREIYREPDRAVTAVAFAPDGRQLYFTSMVTQSDIWTMRTGR